MYTSYLTFSIFYFNFFHPFTPTVLASSYFFWILQFNVGQNIKCWIMKPGDSDIKWKMGSHTCN